MPWTIQLNDETTYKWTELLGSERNFLILLKHSNARLPIPVIKWAPALFLALASTLYCAHAARAENQLLPPGDYVYLGERNKGSAPKTFSVDTNGSITWKDQDEKPAPHEPEPAATNQPSADQTSSKSHKHFGLPIFSSKKSQPAGQNKDPNATKTQQIGGSKKWQPISSHFESYNFPTIEWKPKPLPVPMKESLSFQLLWRLGQADMGGAI